MQKEGKNTVLMLTRNKLYLCDGANILKLDFPASVVSDLDVQDRDGLFNLITNFIQSNKLVASQIYLVLAESVCFSKDFPVNSTTDPVKAEALVTEFTETIPFASVLIKTYKTAVAWRVVGANQDLIDTIFEAFANRGFGLSALIPAALFPDLAMTTDLTPQKAQIVLSKKELAVGGSMVGAQTGKNQQLTTTQTAVPKNKLLPYLIAAFIALMIVLAILLLRR